MPYDPDRHHRRSIRLRGYDYTQAGAYFVTIVTQDRAPLFGDVVAGGMQLNDAGRMVEQEWLNLPDRFPSIELDAFVVMPNHVHGIIVIGDPAIIDAPDVGAGLVPALESAPDTTPPNTTVDSIVRPVDDGQKRAGTGPAPTMARSLGNIVGAFKSITTHAYIQGVKQRGWPEFRGRVWQRNYYEHIIRDDPSLQRIRQYIESNPEQWAADRENLEAADRLVANATPPITPDPLIPAHGGYRHLKSFQVAQLAYDVTVRFCDRYIDKRSRTHDQMVQAARSGVQNIAEGSQASGTSKKMEMKLTNVARASLEELKLDYEDFLRQRGLALWPRSDRRRQHLIDRRPQSAEDVAQWIREVHEKGGQSGHGGLGGRGGLVDSTPSTESTQSTPPPPTYPEIAANAALVLIAVATGLLDRQLAAQAKAFEEDGGFTERLYRTRTQRRKGQ